MAKAPKTFTIQGTLNPGSSAQGLSVSAISSTGKTLDSETINGTDSFELSFKTKKALKQARKGNISLVVDDLNGDAANLIFEDASGDLSPDSQSSSHTIKAKRGSASINLNLESTTVGPEITPPAVEANRITLTTFEDIYSNALGGQVIGGTFTPNNERFTAGQDVVTAAAGTLGQNDNLNDATTGDNDQLRVTTTANNTLQAAVAGVSTVVGLENLIVSATNDASAEADLSKFSGLSSVLAEGSFSNRLELKNYLSSGATTFDFSGVNTGGVNISNANRGTDTASPLTLIGSRAEDILEANVGPATLRGGLGDDVIRGSQVSGVYVDGGQNTDNITLFDNNAKDTVSLRTITTFNDRDNITNFAGAQNNANYDVLEFDAITFTNYTAGTDVQVVNAAQAAAAASAGAGQNMLVVDTFANIRGLNASAQGTSWIAYANDTERAYYSANGDFSQEFQNIAFLNGLANNLTAENIAIV